MPLKNYSAESPAEKSIMIIQKCLVNHGAAGIAFDYEQGTGKIEALMFVLDLGGRRVPFKLPVNWRNVQQVLINQRVGPAGYKDDVSYRIAWACLRDWVTAQMAMLDTELVSMPQIFLPFAVRKSGKTFFEEIASDPKLLLE